MKTQTKNSAEQGQTTTGGQRKSTSRQDGEQTTSSPRKRRREHRSKAASNNSLTFSAKPGTKGNSVVSAQIGDAVVACDTFNIANAKARSGFIESICERVSDIDQDSAERDLIDLATVQHGIEPTEELNAEELLSKMPAEVRDEAKAMLESPDLMNLIVDDIAKCGVAGEQELTTAIYLVGTSRLLDKPLSAIVQAPSSTGKSYTVETPAKLFPPEAVIPATSMTPKAMVYMPSGTLKHKFCVNGERNRRQDDEAADATKMRREMQSSGRISQLVPIQKDGGRMVTELIQQEGPMAFVETTTVQNIFNEDANRCLILSPDEQPEQTARIIDFQADRATGVMSVNEEPIVQRHHALQRMLNRRRVKIPFAHEIKEPFKGKRIEARRAFPQLLSMIEASALLHQYQRQIDSDGCVVADLFDYELAECLCRGSLARLLEGHTSGAAQRFLDWLRQWESRNCFIIAEAARNYKVTKEAVRGWLNELKDAGLVEVSAPHRGSQPAEWKMVETQVDLDTAGFGTSCDNHATTKPNLAQILSKNRRETVSTSKKQRRAG